MSKEYCESCDFYFDREDLNERYLEVDKNMGVAYLFCDSCLKEMEEVGEEQ